MTTQLVYTSGKKHTYSNVTAVNIGQDKHGRYLEIVFDSNICTCIDLQDIVSMHCSTMDTIKSLEQV
jgi:hypothetical protein